MSPYLFSLICAAISIAFLWPSEGAISGDGLPWVLGWAIVATLLAFGRSSTQKTSSSKWRSAPVLLLVAGFWLSTWHVFRIEGDRRAALNLAFEWTSIGLACWCMRRLPAKYLHRLPALIVALGIGVSVLGILQYHVANERLADWYRSQTATLDSSASPVDRRAVEAEFQRLGIPVDPTRRQLFERRLLDSSEPTGPFALANTFGGVLAVVFVFIFAGILNGYSKEARNDFVSLVGVCLLAGLVGYCLILTKSRTAWVGCVAGLFCLFAGRMDNFAAWIRKAAIVSGGLVVAGIVGVASGAIDREVLLEAPKSLQYRLFYWTGAVGVIQDSPLFGSGPGNFRQAYLAHKVSESSEEILDPHNVFIDAWCSAGLIGFVGLVWMSITVVSALRRPTDQPKPGAQPQQKVRPGLLVKGIAIAVLFHLGLQWFGGGSMFDFGQDFFQSKSLLLVVPLVAGLTMFLVSGRFSPPASSAVAAFVALMVHLLGAGGLQITVVGLLMIVCYCIATGTDSSSSAALSIRASLNRPVMAGMFSAIALAVFWYGIKPGVVTRHHLEVAEFRKAMGDKRAALDSLDSAVAADPLSVDSRQQKADFLTYEFYGSTVQYAPKDGELIDFDSFNADFDACVKAIEDLIQSDRHRVQGYYLRSRLYRYRKNWLPGTSFTRCLADMEHVVEIYPTNVKAWAELAILRDEASVAEVNVACDTALRLDSINRSWGHIDRYLDDDLVERLNALNVSK